jgi:hypothetical protein
MGEEAAVPQGLLFSQMDPDPELELAFHRWYDEDHIAHRMHLPGFRSARRFVVAGEGPYHLATYELDSLDALASEPYRRLKQDPGPRTTEQLQRVRSFTRYTGRLQSDAGTSEVEPGRLFVVAFEVPEDVREEFDAWYEEEHVPLLLEVPGWLRVRRYVLEPDQEGPQLTHLALHGLRGPEVLDAPERARLATPWRARLAANDWFQHSLRWTYRPIAGAEAQER